MKKYALIWQKDIKNKVSKAIRHIISFALIALVFMACTKEDDVAVQDVRIVGNTIIEEDTATTSSKKMRIDEVKFKALPTSPFWRNPDYYVEMQIRDKENLLLDIEGEWITTFPVTTYAYAEASEKLIRIIILDFDAVKYTEFEVLPKDYENQEEFTISLEDKFVEIELKGKMLD